MKNLLIIAGAAGVGKTNLACRIVQDLASEHQVMAVKVISGFDKACKLCVSVLRDEDYIILEQHTADLSQDAGQFIAAGAHRAWTIQARGLGLQRCWSLLQRHLPPHSPIVVVSDDLVKLEDAAKLVLLLGGLEENDASLSSRADLTLSAACEPDIKFLNGAWSLGAGKI